MTHKTVLVTRPHGDEAGLMRLLQENGHHAIHEPLTEIILDHTVRPALTMALAHEPDGIIVTSRHGVQSLTFLTEMRDLPLLCVGETTAQTAEDCGFSRVSACGGTLHRLQEYIQDAYDDGSRFVYISASHIREDLTQSPGLQLMEIERIVAYEARAADGLSDTLCEQIRRGQIDVVTLMSQRSGQIFADLLARAQLADYTGQLWICGMSEAIVAPLRFMPWKGISVADEATLASLVECVNIIP